MKNKILILITVFGFFNGFAQQFPLQSQYQLNYASMNPAAVGEFDYVKMVASYRNQWVGFSKEAIATQYFTVTKGFGLNGLGLTLLSDKTGGAFSSTGFRVSYSHKVKYNNHELFLGISGGGTNMRVSAIDEPGLILNNTDFVPDAAFGAYVTLQDWRIGVSIPGILNSNMEFTSSSENQVKSNVYSMVSYTKELNDNWSLHPSVLVKNSTNHQQFDANLNVKFRNVLWFGSSYRTSPNKSSQVQEAFGPSFYLGVNLGRLFSVYSHDFSSGDMSSYPTHEVTIGYDFRPLVNQETENVEEVKISDIDADGVADSLDLCPNLYGSVQANGCPDFDKDGIPDKYDLCPEIPGSFEAGCPDLTENEKEIIKDVSNNLEFAAASDKLKRSSYSSLSQLAVLLIRNPMMFLEIHGYASSEGETDYNLGLSARRSKTVEDFLLSKGVSRNSLIIRFSGEDFPIASNDSEAGRSKNRRVEMSIRFHLKDNAQVVSMEEAYNKALRLVNGTSPLDNVRSEEVISVLENNKGAVDQREEQEKIDDIMIVEEEEIQEPVVDIAEEGRYIIVVQVFSSKSNTEKYIQNSSENLEYIKDGGKYYVYIYRSDDRNEAVKFRSSYKGSCWIKSVKR